MDKKTVIINADMGESFGSYKIGNDEEVMKYVTSANLACGFHAGDPSVMKYTVDLAKKYGVSVGAHPGLQDIRGFGRRRMDISNEDLYNDVIYQLGALDAFIKLAGMKMMHVCPHGTLDPMTCEEEKYVYTFMQAIKDYNNDLLIVAENKSLIAKKSKEWGVKIITVGYPDLKFDSNGDMLIERVKKLANPEEVASQAVSMAKYGVYAAVDGKMFDIQADMLCFHADVPNAVEILKAVRKSLEEENIEIIGL